MLASVKELFAPRRKMQQKKIKCEIFYNRAKNEMLTVDDEAQMSIEDFIGGVEC